jgi:hypothetical protein
MYRSELVHAMTGLERRMYEHLFGICNIQTYIHQEQRHSRTLMQFIKGAKNSNSTFAKFSNIGIVLADRYDQHRNLHQRRT